MLRRLTTTASEDLVDTGRHAAESLEQALTAQGLSIAGFRRLLDFGCGSGDVLRHFAPLFQGREFHGTDTDRAAIDRASAQLPGVTFHHHDAEPPLPFPDCNFDSIWSIGAFSRLPGESAARWLAQLRLILRRGGIALVAVQGLFRFNEDVARGCIRPEAIREFDSRGFTYVHACTDRRLPDWYEHAFMTEDYSRGLFGQYFDVLDYLPRGMMQRQDLLVLRRR